MSLDYSIRLDDPDVVRISSYLVSDLGVRDTGKFNGRVSFRADGIGVCIYSETDLGREVVYENFGFSSESRLECTVAKFDANEAGITSLLRIVWALLQRSTVHRLVLLQNGEVPLLFLRDGELLASNHDSYWVTKWESLLPANSYALQDLPRI